MEREKPQAINHFVETGMSMKQLCDIAVLMHTFHDKIDKVLLQDILTKLHLLEVWQLIMWIMVHDLGLSENECPFYTDKSNARAELLFAKILQEGSSYRKEEVNASGASYLKRKWLTFLSRLEDSRRVRPYAPHYARHMVIADILHGIERTMRRK